MGRELCSYCQGSSEGHGRYSGGVGLAHNLPKVKQTCTRPQSGTETLRIPPRCLIIIGETKKTEFLRFLSFSKFLFSQFFVFFQLLNIKL